MISRCFLKALAIALFGFFATLSAQVEETGSVGPMVPPPSQTTQANLPEVEIQNLDAVVKDMIVQSMSAQVAEAVVTSALAVTRVPTPNEVRSTQPFKKEFHELETGESPGSEFTSTPREPLQTTTEEEEPPA
ncbi:MAG: hypothetical protein K1000chlam4_00562 [Chlamydiae bacterium]|nr:hypothetical protein [Chlamydiota bacterium]